MDNRADGEAAEPLVDLARVEAQEVAELEVGDPTLGDEATDVSHADVEACCDPVNVEEGLDVGARRVLAKGHARKRALRVSGEVSGLPSCEPSGRQVFQGFLAPGGVWCLVLGRQDRLVNVSGVWFGSRTVGSSRRVSGCRQKPPVEVSRVPRTAAGQRQLRLRGHQHQPSRVGAVGHGPPGRLDGAGPGRFAGSRKALAGSLRSQPILKDDSSKWGP